MRRVVVEPPAAMEPPPAPSRKRPLIYIYDMEPLYSTKLLQYRWPVAACCPALTVPPWALARPEGPFCAPWHACPPHH